MDTLKPNKTLSPQRLALVRDILKAANITEKDFTSQEVVDCARDFILKNIELLATLPAYVVGDLSNLETDTYRRTLMAFLRRLAKFLGGSITSRRHQYTIQPKTNRTVYFYKLII